MNYSSCDNLQSPLSSIFTFINYYISAHEKKFTIIYYNGGNCDWGAG